MATSKQVQDGGAVACSTKQTQLGEGIRWDARRGEMLAVGRPGGARRTAATSKTTVRWSAPMSTSCRGPSG